MPYRISARPAEIPKCWEFLWWHKHDYVINQPAIYPQIYCRKCETIKLSTPGSSEYAKAYHNSDKPVHDKDSCFDCYEKYFELPGQIKFTIFLSILASAAYSYFSK